jgi:hypothetical protein
MEGLPCWPGRMGADQHSKAVIGDMTQHMASPRAATKHPPCFAPRQQCARSVDRIEGAHGAMVPDRDQVQYLATNDRSTHGVSSGKAVAAGSTLAPILVSR